MSTTGIQYATACRNPGDFYIHKLLPVAIVYFFFNTAGLPPAVCYTAMMTPFFAVWLYLEGKRWVNLSFLVYLLPFMIAHICLGVDSPFYYFRSVVFIWTVYITVYAICWALLKSKSLDRLFEKLIVLNFWAAVAAVVLHFPPISNLLWRDDLYFAENHHTQRLQLLDTEPSVYAFMMAPLLIFAVLRLLNNHGKRNLIYVALIAVPFLLCQSFGGLSTCLAGLAVSLAVSRNLFRRRSTLLIVGLVVLLIAVILIVPNPISTRVFQVILGSDSSTRSRTGDAFIAAYAIASSKSIWWGVGLGQAKLFELNNVGLGIALKVGVIPNAIADAFAQLGIVAVVLKFALEIYLFFRTRVYRNSFRLAMFVIIFIFQCTGSSITNIQEYILWCMAFAPFFPEMDRKKDTAPRAAASGPRFKLVWADSRLPANLGQIKET